jgi:hypothetical protein
MRKWVIITLVLLGFFAGVLLFASVWAPATSAVDTSAQSGQVSCLQNAQGNCLIFPAVSGVNLDNEEIAFPEAFGTGYALVVVPFDRDQQVLATTWLPSFQELAAERADLTYYSIAALPDLAAGIRLLVLGGMSAGTREPELRQRAVVMFLEDQARFLEALEVADANTLQVFVVDASGVIFWRGSGEYTEESAGLLREWIASSLLAG